MLFLVILFFYFERLVIGSLLALNPEEFYLT